MGVLETQVRAEVPVVVERRPGTAGPDNRFGRKRPARCHGPAACAQGERRPRHSSSPVPGWRALHFHTGEERGETDAAPGASAGGKHGCDERSRSEQTGFPPVGGDRQIADCSAVTPRQRPSMNLSAFICVICGFSVAMCEWLCDAFMFTMPASVCLSLCSLCLCG